MRHAGPPARAAADTVAARDTPQRGASRKYGVGRRRVADCGARQRTSQAAVPLASREIVSGAPGQQQRHQKKGSSCAL